MKVSEILDDPLYDAGVEQLATSCIAYTFCRECGHVDDGLETLRNKPCATCGIAVDTRTILFCREVQIVRTIFECYKSIESRSLCVLLFCSLIEQHIRNLVLARCERLNIAPLITQILLEKSWKVDSRLKLFEQLTGISVKKALEGHAGARVFEAYAQLQAKRNKLAHGEPWSHLRVKDEDVRCAVDAAANSFPAMALLYHNYCAVDSPPLPTV